MELFEKFGQQVGAAARAGSETGSIVFVHLAETNPEAFDDTMLGEHASFFAVWTPGGEAYERGKLGYRVGQIRTDPEDGNLYRCSQTHGTEHANVPPSKSPTLWGRIANPEDEWPEWFPFNGSNADAWMINSRCSHKKKKWISNVNHNVWEPGTTGAPWTEHKD